MEVKINKEIRSYREKVYFGLTLRQFVCSLGAVIAAVAVYVILKPHVGSGTIAWFCILAALPPAALGFVNYHGMTCERFLWVWLRDNLLEPRKLSFAANNLYAALLNDKWMVEKETEEKAQKAEKPKKHERKQQ